MEYLVESHLGGYYISDSDIVKIVSFCKNCGDRDRIILSWEKGKKMEALSSYFSRCKKSKKEIDADYENGLSKDELVDYLIYQYECDIYLINDLFENGMLNKVEQIKLLKQVSNSQKKQFKIFTVFDCDNKFVKVYSNRFKD